VSVLVRGARTARGVCTGHLLAFDKHFNLVRAPHHTLSTKGGCARVHTCTREAKSSACIVRVCAPVCVYACECVCVCVCTCTCTRVCATVC
jgi:hypothetical protein